MKHPLTDQRVKPLRTVAWPGFRSPTGAGLGGCTAEKKRILVYACELWVFAMCPALRGSTVSYAGDAHFPKHSLEYSLNF